MKKTILLIMIFATGILKGQHLKNYIKIALENNPSIQKYNEAYLASTEKIKASGNFPETVIGMGGFIAPVATRLGDQQFKWMLNQNIPLWGTLKKEKTIAHFESQSAKNLHKLQMAKIIQQVKKAYFALVFSKEYIGILKKQDSLLKSLETVQIAQIKTGQKDLITQLKTQTKRIDLQAKIKNEQRNLKAKKYAFNLMLNRGENETVFVSNKFPQETVQKANNLQKHPQTNALKNLEKAMEMREKLMQKKRLPQFSIGLNYIVVAARPLQNLPENGRDILMPTIGLKIPVFSKKYSANAKKIQRQKTALKAAQKSVVNTLKIKLKNALTTLKNLQENHQSLIAQEKNITAMIAVIHTNYKHQKNDFQSLVASQQMQWEIKIKQLKTMQKIANTKALFTFLNTQTK